MVKVSASRSDLDVTERTALTISASVVDFLLRTRERGHAIPGASGHRTPVAGTNPATRVVVIGVAIAAPKAARSGSSRVR